MAFSSWLGSASTVHRRGVRTASISIVSPSVRWSKSDIPGINRLMSTAFGARGCRREKAKAAGSTLPHGQRREGAIGVPLEMTESSGSFCRSRSRFPLTIWRRLLKSLRSRPSFGRRFPSSETDAGLHARLEVLSALLHPLLERLIHALRCSKRLALSMAIAAWPASPSISRSDASVNTPTSGWPKNNPPMTSPERDATGTAR